MSVYKVDAGSLRTWLDGIISRQRVIGVQAKDDRFIFAPLLKATDLRLDYDVTILPPKLYLQPPKETIITFNSRQNYSSLFDSDPFILFGVHPYDMVAITQMDEIFTQDNQDDHYVLRRSNATIVVTDVQRVSPHVFAGYMGTAYLEDGYDVLITMIGDLFLVDARTEKGEFLVADIDGGSKAGKSWLEQRRMVWEYNKQRLRRHELRVEPSKWQYLLENSYQHPLWQERADLCFSCGSCTMVCPTCYCFNIKDDVNWDLSSGERVRIWDSCMLTNFAAVAGNINFRKDVTARFRHRYYRKALYVPKKIGGQIACVGCGRCITACPANIANPVEVINRLGEAK